MYVTMNYNMYTICIRNTARSKTIPLLCTHVYSYMFSTVHPPRVRLSQMENMLTLQEGDNAGDSAFFTRSNKSFSKQPHNKKHSGEQSRDYINNLTLQGNGARYDR